MNPEIKHDKYGHCSLCHKNMLIEQIIDGKPTMRFLPDYVEAEYLLDDNSKMRVAMCTQCKTNLSEDDNETVMDTVKRGWQEQVKKYDHWTQERKNKYLETYNKKEIVCMSAGVPDDILATKLSVYKAKKEKANGGHK